MRVSRRLLIAAERRGTERRGTERRGTERRGTGLPIQGGEQGRAILEFIFLGILLLLPLTYLVLTAARLQAASFSVSLAGREAGRAFVTARSDDEGLARARAAASLAFADFAFDRGADVAVSCDGSPCLRPEGTVTATATIAVALPLVPDFIAAHVPSSVTISSTHVASVDRFVAR